MTQRTTRPPLCARTDNSRIALGRSATSPFVVISRFWDTSSVNAPKAKICASVAAIRASFP